MKIQICKLISLENVSDCYFINDDLEIINSNTSRTKKWTLGKRGYFYVSLNAKVTNKQLKIPVHKIIALAFIKNEPYEVINHINGNKLDNRVENLEFVTQQYNIRHAFDKKLVVRKEKIFKVVVENSSEYVGTMKELTKELNIPKGTLYDLYYKGTSSGKYKINKIILQEEKV